jgi:hypothetical protein
MDKICSLHEIFRKFSACPLEYLKPDSDFPLRVNSTKSHTTISSQASAKNSIRWPVSSSPSSGNFLRGLSYSNLNDEANFSGIFFRLAAFAVISITPPLNCSDPAAFGFNMLKEIV